MDNKQLSKIVCDSIKLAKQLKHEYVTAEHMLYVMCHDDKFMKAFSECGGDLSVLKGALRNFFFKNMEEVEYQGSPELSVVMEEALTLAERFAAGTGSDTVEAVHLLYGISQANESYACFYIAAQHVDCEEVIYRMQYDEEADNINNEANSGMFGVIDNVDMQRLEIPGTGFGIIISGFPPQMVNRDTPQEVNRNARQQRERDKKEEPWRKLVVNLNEAVKEKKEPLVGREDIIKRTMQILCRKYKSNAIHLGEPGVGKTAITMGLARLLNEGLVPEQLKGATIFSLDMGSLVAGTQFRGDFEKKLEMVIEGLKTVEKPIVYIDEIHTMVGAGAGSESNMDASNLLKKTLTEGKIKFIGATTYEEYKKYFEKDKALSRRFKTIDVRETSEEETIEILHGIKKYYEEYHNVTYTDEAITSAVELSAKYITERYFPDKAIDLLDEAGSFVALTRRNKKNIVIGRDKIEEVLSKTCNIPKQTVETSEVRKLSQLEDDMKKVVFGQDEAIEQLVRCIKISRAGLNEDNKPVASMLFVGPTGTGKTEVAKTLAEKTGVKLIRFDMSEYQEKHTVAKLIGSPAGYVGYDDGGQLTEVIRKNPHCVLLLDEIEKAHPDVYNTLLQVMDNATLTDNQGRSADFRNVVIIMTSNAGARDIGKRGIGFGAVDAGNNVMDAELKRVFAPEFRNRLTKVIKFNPISDEMALMIAEKQFQKLKEKVEAKGIKLTVTKRCYKAIADKGTSIETGAREIQRVIDNEVKPLFVDEILFGDLKEGTKCRLDHLKDGFKIYIK